MQLYENGREMLGKYLLKPCSENISSNFARNFSRKNLSFFLLLYIRNGRNVSFPGSFMKSCSLIYCLHIFTINSAKSFAENSELPNSIRFLAFQYQILSTILYFFSKSLLLICFNNFSYFFLLNSIKNHQI